MRRWHLVVLVGLGVFFSATTVYAADAILAAESSGATPWATLVLAGLGALGVTDRLARWAWKYRKKLLAAVKLLREFAALAEALSRMDDPDNADPKAPELKAAGAFLKDAMRRGDASRTPDELAVLSDAAAEAERRSGHNGSATTAARDAKPAPKSKGARVLHGIGTAAKFLGAFLPGIGRVISR